MEKYEERLNRIINANQPQNRHYWVDEWHAKGKKVAGVISAFVPEEILWAAGILPVRMTGTWSADVAKAVAYRGSSTCSYCNHLLQSILDGEYDDFDAIVVADKDQDIIRLFDVIQYENKCKRGVIIHAPFTSNVHTQEYYVVQIKKIISMAEEAARTKITEEKLLSAIKLYNQLRSLMQQIYDLQKRDVPALTGAEMLGLCTGLQVMDRQFAVDELTELMPYLKTRKAMAKCMSPRIMLSADGLDNPEYISLLEEDCLVVMDDTDLGSRYFHENVKETGDLYMNIAERYIGRLYVPHLDNWDEQLDSIVNWAKEYRAAGVIAMPLTWCNPQRFRWPLVSRRLTENNIPNIVIEREYNFTNAGQVKTRAGAFTEML